MLMTVTNTIHSVGAGASLLSAMGVGVPYTCASTITWAASHYYRHLFGLLPSSITPRTSRRNPINVLWLSRAKLDSYAQKQHDWSVWRDVRHINNEEELLSRIRQGLRDWCQEPNSFGTGCRFEDALEAPETWSTSPTDGALPIRFASLDPTVHTLETQIHYVGHTTILVSSHGGALGLSLFLPPGDAALLELQVQVAQDNYHFQHMAAEMGHYYERLGISRTVDVEQVWGSIQRRIENLTK
jgi:hypothetical protein